MLFNKSSVLVFKYQVLPIRSYTYKDETVYCANPLQICPFHRLNSIVTNYNHAPWKSWLGIYKRLKGMRLEVAFSLHARQP